MERNKDRSRAEMEAQIDHAMRNATDPDEGEVVLVARYDHANALLILELKSGQRIAIPTEDIQGLAGAAPEDISDIELLGPGTGLHWEKLDADFSVRGLVAGRYGSEKWMQGLAQRRRERLSRAS